MFYQVSRPPCLVEFRIWCYQNAKERWIRQRILVGLSPHNASGYRSLRIEIKFKCFQYLPMLPDPLSVFWIAAQGSNDQDIFATNPARTPACKAAGISMALEASVGETVDLVFQRFS